MTDQGPEGVVQPGLRPRLVPGALPPTASAQPAPAPEQFPRAMPTASFPVMTPEEAATGPLGPAPPAPPPKDAPYGMTPGVRHLLGGYPIKRSTEPSTDYLGSFNLKSPGGTVYRFTGALDPGETDTVNALEQSLLLGSGDEREKQIARAVGAWGRSVVGIMRTEDILKTMAERWDHNVGNVIKREISHNKILAAEANRRANAEGKRLVRDESGLPDPNTPFGHQVLGAWNELQKTVINQYTSGESYKALSEHENGLEKMLKEIDSDVPMAQYAALMNRMLEMSGKASTDRERAQLYGGGGAWLDLQNRIKRFLAGTPLADDASMVAAFRDDFRRMIQGDKEAIAATKKQIGIDAATQFLGRAKTEYGEELAQRGADNVYQRFTGIGPIGSYRPPPDDAGKKVIPTYTPPAKAAAPRAAGAAPKAAASSAPKPAAPAPRKLPPGTEDL